MKKSVAGCVILYHPEANVPANVRSYLASLDKLYVVDNGGGREVAESLCLLAPERVEVIENAVNRGIAAPLNEVLRRCEGKFDLLLTMDQDSAFADGNMASYRVAADAFDWTETFGLSPTPTPRGAAVDVLAPPHTTKVVFGGAMHYERQSHFGGEGDSRRRLR